MRVCAGRMRWLWALCVAVCLPCAWPCPCWRLPLQTRGGAAHVPAHRTWAQRATSIGVQSDDSRAVPARAAIDLQLQARAACSALLEARFLASRRFCPCPPAARVHGHPRAARRRPNVSFTRSEVSSAAITYTRYVFSPVRANRPGLTGDDGSRRYRNGGRLLVRVRRRSPGLGIRPTSDRWTPAASREIHLHL